MGPIVNRILIFLICFNLMGVSAVRASIGGKNAAANVLMFASALAAPNVLMQCKKKPSAWIFLGSAGYFLASELLSSKKHKEDSQAIKVDLESKDSSEKQIEALEAAAMAADRAGKAADTRAKNFMMAAMGFGAAAIAAVVEGYLAHPGSIPKPPGCIRPDPETGACTMGACQPVKKTQPKGSQLGNQAPPSSVPGDNVNINLNLDLNSIFSDEEMNFFEMMDQEDFDFFGRIDGSLTPNMGAVAKLEGWLESVGQWWMPSAHAFLGGGMMGKMIAPTMGVGAWYLIKKKFPKAQGIINKALNNGYKRGAVFGGFAALAGFASGSTKSDAKKLKERAKVYRRLAAKMRRRLELKKGMNAGSLQYIPPVATKAGGTPGDSPVVAVGEETSCVVGKPGQYPRIDSSCACKKNNSCKKAVLPKVNYPELPEAEVALNEVGILLKDHADKTYSGNLSGSAKVSDASISRSAAKINRLKKKLWNLASDRLKRGGKKVELSRMQNAYAVGLKKAINSDFQKLSAKDKKELASLSPSFMNGPSLAKGTQSPPPRDLKKTSSAKVRTGEGKGLLKGGKAVALKGFDFLEASGEDGSSEPNQADEPENTAEKGFVDKGIDKNRERSIWKTLSNRYFKLFQ